MVTTLWLSPDAAPDDKIGFRTPHVGSPLRRTEVSPRTRPGVSACLALEPRLSRPGAHWRRQPAGHGARAQRWCGLTRLAFGFVHVNVSGQEPGLAECYTPVD